MDLNTIYSNRRARAARTNEVIMPSSPPAGNAIPSTAPSSSGNFRVARPPSLDFFPVVFLSGLNMSLAAILGLVSEGSSLITKHCDCSGQWTDQRAQVNGWDALRFSLRGLFVFGQ